MKITSKILQHIHLDKTYSLLSGKNVLVLLELFRLLDIHDKMQLNGEYDHLGDKRNTKT